VKAQNQKEIELAVVTDSSHFQVFSAGNV